MTEPKRQRAAKKGSIYLAIALEYIEPVKSFHRITRNLC